MESITATCAICFLGYNDKERRPLVLPCSHSFCQSCLDNLETNNKKECTNCRQAWVNCEVKNLLCCHQLIPNGGKDRGKDTDKCEEHRQDVTTWCNTCNVPICLKCLRNKHKNCEWVLMEEKYDEMLAKLNKLVTENGDTFKSLDDFIKKLRSCCDKLAEWRSKAEKELDNPLPLGKENEVVPVGKVHLKTLALVEMERSEPTNQFTRLLHDLAKAFQETLDGKPETFIKKLKAAKASAATKIEVSPLEFSFGAENSLVASASSSPGGTGGLSTPGGVKGSFSPKTTLSLFGACSIDSSLANANLKTSPTFVSGRKWIIRVDSEIAAACKALKDPLVTPSEVEVIVCDIAVEEPFEEFLSQIGKRKCPVSMKSLYSHWKTSPNDAEVRPTTRTQTRIRRLLGCSTGFQPRCTLTEFWGYLDVECVKLLPQTLKSVGLVLTSEKEMDVLKEFVREGYGRWLWDDKWTCLNTLHIAVSKTFQPAWWKSGQEADIHGSTFGFGNPKPVPDMSKSRTVLKVSLHFPKLFSELELEWMKQMLVKIENSQLEIGSLTDMYLPGLLLDYTKVYDLLKKCHLDTGASLLTVHLPIDAKNFFSLQTKEKMGNCTFVWDLAKL